MSNDTNLQRADNSQIVLYQPDETISLKVKLDSDFNTVWLSIDQMAELFGRDRSVIGKHVRACFKEGELVKDSVWAKFAYTASDGKDYNVDFYNLDVIISVGYRVKSRQGTQFRIWATNVLRSYLLKGYSVSQHLVALQQQIDNRFVALEQKVENQQQQVDFLVKIHNQPSENLFATGCMWDAYAYMAALIRSAKEQVILIDNYCDDKTLTLLDQRNTGIPCTIHTTFNKTIEDALDKHNSQCASIQKIQLPHKIHDRFLIIDTQVYLLGNSLKDMGHTLSAAILTGFTSEDILSKLK